MTKNLRSIFNPKNYFKLSGIWVGSGKKLIPNPVVNKAPDPGSESAALLKFRFRGKGELILKLT
jgi:hypothetical protein